MKTLYILGTGTDGLGQGNGVYNLIADDGEFMASHFCSSAMFAVGDLWRNRPERKEEWSKRFGEYKVIWLGEDDMKLETLIKMNDEWQKTDAEAQKKIEQNGSKIEITVSS